MSNISPNGTGINEASNPYAAFQNSTGWPGAVGTSIVGTTSTVYRTPPWQIVSMSLEGGKLIVIKEQEVGVTLTLLHYPYSQYATILKEIYAVQGNEIVLEQTVRGRYVPPVSTEGHYEFDEQV